MQSKKTKYYLAVSPKNPNFVASKISAIMGITKWFVNNPNTEERNPRRSYLCNSCRRLAREPNLGQRVH